MRPGPDVPRPGGDRGFWLEEALRADPGAPCPSLRGRVRADVCIVGGGLAGLWTAIELIERESSLRIALIEADICGGGASGRNGGFFSSSWHDLPAIVGLFGRDEGVRYALALADEVTEVGRWCAANEVDAWFHREGVLGVCTGRWQEGFGGGPALELCAKLGLGDRIVALDAGWVPRPRELPAVRRRHVHRGQRDRAARVSCARAPARRARAGGAGVRADRRPTGRAGALARRSMPVVGREIVLAPPEPVRFPLVRAAAWGLETGDRREDAGRPRGSVRRLIGDAPGRYRERIVRRAGARER